MRNFLFYFSRIISYLIPYTFYSRVSTSILLYLYTGYVSREFKYFGKRTFVKSSFSLLKGPNNISVGNGTFFGKNMTLTAWEYYKGQTFTPQILIGNNCSFGANNHVTAINLIQIGNNVLTGKDVLITDNAHGESVFEVLNISPKDRLLFSKGTVIIEDNVWIGEKASILPGVHIGEGCIIAANSVVTKDMPEFSVVAGIPAKVIKKMK